MADNYLITGYWGEPHVTAENDRGIHAAIFGDGRLVLPVGERFRAEYIGNNTIRMYDGKLMDGGAAAGIPVGEYIDFLISNASQNMNRNDLIVFQYSQDASTLVETGSFLVLQGTETEGTAEDPELTQESVISGTATFDQMAMWRVSVSGTAISAPEKLFTVTEIVKPEASSVMSVDGVPGDTGGNIPLSAVRYSAQSLTDGQQKRARANIGANKVYYGSSEPATYCNSNNITPVAGDLYMKLS